ncbi:MAG TPA: MFS transporter [Longimicrobiaceae bacterium]|nr:MFS transporter [Longimicrobiaceae bacterium]
MRKRHAASLLRGNVLWLSVVSLLNDAASEMIYPLLPIFLTVTLGAGPALLGAIEGVAESASSLLKLLGGWVSDRWGRRRALVAWGYGIAAVGRPLIGLAAAPWQVLAVRFADRLGKGLRTAPRDALLAESVEPDRRGTAFGIHRAADHAGAVVGPLLATGILLLLPGQVRTVFLLAAVPGLLTLLVVLWKVRDPAPTVAPSLPGETPLRPSLRELGPAFPRYLAVLVLFTLGNSTDAFLLLRAQQLGVAVALVPLLWTVLHLSKATWSVVGGVVADRWGARRAIVAGWGVYAAVYAGFAAATDAWHAWALFAVYGLFFGLTEAPEKALVARLAPPGLHGRAFGTYHFAIGLAALPASLLFGALWAGFGARAAFLTGAGIALASALLLLLALPRQEAVGR